MDIKESGGLLKPQFFFVTIPQVIQLPIELTFFSVYLVVLNFDQRIFSLSPLRLMEDVTSLSKSLGLRSYYTKMASLQSVSLSIFLTMSLHILRYFQKGKKYS